MQTHDWQPHLDHRKPQPRQRKWRMSTLPDGTSMSSSNSLGIALVHGYDSPYFVLILERHNDSPRAGGRILVVPMVDGWMHVLKINGPRSSNAERRIFRRPLRTPQLRTAQTPGANCDTPTPCFAHRPHASSRFWPAWPSFPEQRSSRGWRSSNARADMTVAMPRWSYLRPPKR